MVRQACSNWHGAVPCQHGTGWHGSGWHSMEAHSIAWPGMSVAQHAMQVARHGGSKGAPHAATAGRRSACQTCKGTFRCLGASASQPSTEVFGFGACTAAAASAMPAHCLHEQPHQATRLTHGTVSAHHKKTAPVVQQQAVQLRLHLCTRLCTGVQRDQLHQLRAGHAQQQHGASPAALPAQKAAGHPKCRPCPPALPASPGMPSASLVRWIAAVMTSGSRPATG